MSAERIVIVGAGPAGLATARSYRESGGRGEVTIVGEEPHLPYSRPPLTKDLLRGEIDARELPIERESWFREQQIHTRLLTTAVAIDPANGTVSVAAGDRLQADAIVLATGSEPTRPEIPGMEDPRVLTLRRLEDSLRLAETVGAELPVLVIGTGFIGCEIAGSLALAGARVVLIGQDPLPQLARLGEHAARAIAGWLAELGVELVAEATVSAVHDARTVELRDGRRLQGGCVVLAAGVRPRAELAQAAGLELSDGAIAVDERMRSRRSPTVVLAAGDVACAHNTLAGRPLRVEHWGDALEHGEVAGRTLAGLDAHWDSVPGFWSTIGARTLKYAAWGDGYDRVRADSHPGGAFTVWYEREGAAVGVLAHERDEDYERGRELIATGAPPP